MIQTGDTYFREYYVSFTDSDHLPWLWRLFTRKGFEHCSVYMATGQDSCISVCQTMFDVVITTYPHNVHIVADALVESGGSTVVYVPHARLKMAKLRLGVLIPTCVSLCQRLTGLTFHAFTPYYYYRALLSRGCHELKGKNHGRNV